MTQGLSILKYIKMLQIRICEEVSHAFHNALLTSFMLTLSAYAQEKTDASVITGRAAVLKGDTIEINGQKIRLHGIDAPQHRQTCHDRRGLLYRCGT